MEQSDKKEYEIGYITSSEEGGKAVAKILTGMGAEVSFEAPLAKVALAYPIKKHASAYFGYSYFNATPDIISSVRDSLKMKPEVLRSLIMTPPTNKRNVAEESSAAPRVRPVVRTHEPRTAPLSNEALEKKIEEILK